MIHDIIFGNSSKHQCAGLRFQTNIYIVVFYHPPPLSLAKWLTSFSFGRNFCCQDWRFVFKEKSAMFEEKRRSVSPTDVSFSRTFEWLSDRYTPHPCYATAQPLFAFSALKFPIFVFSFKTNANSIPSHQAQQVFYVNLPLWDASVCLSSYFHLL